MMAELFGKSTGYAGGRGGTQHMADFSIGFLGMNGITGGMLPVATGAAFSARYRKSGQVALAFLGDGASNQGTFHEALNMASIWTLPVIYLCENNLYAMSTPARAMLSVEDIAIRATSYGMPGVIVDGNDVSAVRDAVAEAATRARAGEGPTLIEAKTYRTLGHSRGDLRVYRTREEEAGWAMRDPIRVYADRLIARAELTDEEFARLDREAVQTVADAEAFARASAVAA
jgi:TPP-dependent pyruvate/acetoin dehydrogenase alpha subunit